MDLLTATAIFEGLLRTALPGPMKCPNAKGLRPTATVPRGKLGAVAIE